MCQVPSAKCRHEPAQRNTGVTVGQTRVKTRPTNNHKKQTYSPQVSHVGRVKTGERLRQGGEVQGARCQVPT
jgi:hypothetical protein